MIYVHRYNSPMGDMTMASDGRALTGLWFDGQRYFPQGLAPCGDAPPPDVFAEAARWLDVYFSGREPDFTPPVALDGTPFRASVWALLMEIPYGRTVTYGALAGRLAAGGASACARAVGGAVARNPISIIVPCHRVVGSGGRLGGYAGGAERKRRLLALEGARL